jgi:hypothetical protein
MTNEETVELYSDPRVKNALARLMSTVPGASISQAVRAAVLYVGEGAPEHEIKVYLEEQVNLEGG